MEELREEDILQVEDAMQPVEGPVLDAEETVEKALQHVDGSRGEDLLVRLSPSGWSTVTRDHLRAMASEGKASSKLGPLLLVPRIPYLHPDLPLETALRYIERWKLVPVVSRANFQQLEGVVSQRSVLDRYREFGEG